jgi:hypothetical protein
MTVEGNREMELRSQLKRHFEEIVGVYASWFGRPAERPRFKGQLLVEHRVSGAAFFFMANGQHILQPLILPGEFASLVESVKAHLGDEGWKKWEDLVAEMNSNLSAAVSLWNEIGERLGATARKVGLFSASTPMEPLVDRYWPELFIASIWQEPEYYEGKKVHSWESAIIVEDEVTLFNSHQFDTFQTWIFANSNMVRSQSKHAVETMKKAWESEGTRVDPILRKLRADQVRIEESAREFQGLLGSLQSEYTRTSRLQGACATCNPWIDELNSSPPSPSTGTMGSQTALLSSVADPSDGTA